MMLYNFFDILLITYLGNEIKLADDRLSYRFFESDWIDRRPSTKKSIIIFVELTMHPSDMLIFKLFPLSVETFTKVCLQFVELEE